MHRNDLAEVLDRPLSRELLARDVARLAYVAKDGTPRAVPIAFTWNGTEIVLCTTTNAPKLPALRANPVVALTIDTEVRSLYDSMVRIVVTPTWAKLIDFETTLPSAVEELVARRAERA